MSRRQQILLGMAIVGFFFANTMATLFIVRHGFDLGAYIEDLFASLPAAQFTGDIVWAFVAFSLWAAWEGRRLGMRSWWMPVPASMFIGLCFALPLFLYLRDRHLNSGPPATLGARIDSGRV